MRGRLAAEVIPAGCLLTGQIPALAGTPAGSSTGTPAATSWPGLPTGCACGAQLRGERREPDAAIGVRLQCTAGSAQQGASRTAPGRRHGGQPLSRTASCGA
jgi:hypothetical protein